MLRLPVRRCFASTRLLLAPNEAAQQAASKEKAANRESNKKNEVKKFAKLKAKARSDPKKSPFYSNILDALKYIRACEVGRPEQEASINISALIVAEKGSTPVSGSIKFPNAIKSVKTMFLSNDSKLVADANELGIELVGGSALIDRILKNEVDLDSFDRAFAGPDIVKELNKVARVLGPKGLMPSVKKSTVTSDIRELYTSLGGSLPFKQGGSQIQLTVGRAQFTDEQIIQNLIAASNAIRDAISKQKGKKQVILGWTSITSTRSPAFHIDF